MKKLLILILLTVATLAAHSQNTTNAFSVVLSTNQMAALVTAWKYDNDLRTNSLSPYSTNESMIYTNPAPAQTFAQFAGGISSEGLAEKVLILEARREAEMLALWRKAGPTKKRMVMVILK